MTPKNPLTIETYSDYEWINALFYGDPGAGKTWLTGTAGDDPRTSPVLMIDIDGGLKTIKHKLNKGKIDAVKVRSLEQLTKLYNELYHSIEKDTIYYRTVALDNCSELADLDMQSIMKEAYSRNPDKVDIDVPSQREWGKSRGHMRKIVRAFRDLPCNVIFTAHVATIQEDGQPTKYSPGFAGKLRTDLPGFVDVVGYLRPIATAEGVMRQLQVQGTNRVVAKDRTSALGTVLENPTIPGMWDIIQNYSADIVNSKTAA